MPNDFNTTSRATEEWLGHDPQFFFCKSKYFIQVLSGSGEILLAVIKRLNYSTQVAVPCWLLSIALSTFPRTERRVLVQSFSSAVGGVVGVVPIYGSSLGVADYQVSTLVHTGDTLHVAQPHDDLFDTAIVDEPADP
ncbi:hypothetical protein Tco_0603664 [Tanacetum coccineum]